MKALVTMSENKEEQKGNNEYMRSIDAEFENYIPHLVDMTKNTTKFNESMRLSAMNVIANLALRDYLRP